MQKVDTAGVKQNVALARDRNPDFEEEILPFNELNTFLDEVLYECPHCGDGNVTLYGTMHGCYSQEWQRGMPGPFRPEAKEAQSVDFFVMAKTSPCTPCCRMGPRLSGRPLSGGF
jgi:hypothetical protein